MRVRVWQISKMCLPIIIIMIMTTITTTMIINRSCVAFCQSGTQGTLLPGGTARKIMRRKELKCDHNPFKMSGLAPISSLMRITHSNFVCMSIWPE